MPLYSLLLRTFYIPQSYGMEQLRRVTCSPNFPRLYDVYKYDNLTVFTITNEQ